MELFVGSTRVPALVDRPYASRGVPVFSAIAPHAIVLDKSEKDSKNMIPYLPAHKLEPHKDLASDIIIQAGVPCTIAFLHKMGNWLGHPYKDWEVPGSSPVVTE